MQLSKKSSMLGKNISMSELNIMNWWDEVTMKSNNARRSWLPDPSNWNSLTMRSQTLRRSNQMKSEPTVPTGHQPQDNFVHKLRFCRLKSRWVKLPNSAELCCFRHNAHAQEHLTSVALETGCDIARCSLLFDPIKLMFSNWDHRWTWTN